MTLGRILDAYDRATRRPDDHVFNPIEQRLYGLVEIAEGVNMVFRGAKVKGWTLAVALWGAERAQRERERYRGH